MVLLTPSGCFFSLLMNTDIKQFPLSGLFSSYWVLVKACEEGSNKPPWTNEARRGAETVQVK